VFVVVCFYDMVVLVVVIVVVIVIVIVAVNTVCMYVTMIDVLQPHLCTW